MEKDGEMIVCINCGHPVGELYRKYGESVIKMTNCGNCNQIADKYIEFEPVVILIDLILLSKATYRHILFNGQFKNFWKLFVILILLESFMKWSTLPPSDNAHETEKNFYICSLWVILENGIYFCILRMSVLLFDTVLRRRKEELPGRCAKISKPMWKSIILASLGKFLCIPIVIWQDNSSDVALQIHSILVMGYFLLSLICSCSVVLCYSRLETTSIVLMTLLIKSLTLNHLSILVKIP
ncbi:ARV1 [Sergentomyia squamirostris]